MRYTQYINPPIARNTTSVAKEHHAHFGACIH